MWLEVMMCLADGFSYCVNELFVLLIIQAHYKTVLSYSVLKLLCCCDVPHHLDPLKHPINNWCPVRRCAVQWILTPRSRNKSFGQHVWEEEPELLLVHKRIEVLWNKKMRELRCPLGCQVTMRNEQGTWATNCYFRHQIIGFHDSGHKMSGNCLKFSSEFSRVTSWEEKE